MQDDLPVVSIDSDEEIDQKKIKTLLLNEKEWAKIEALMDSDEEPTSDLRKLMKSQ